jgi:hypothetical protein
VSDASFSPSTPLDVETSPGDLRVESAARRTAWSRKRIVVTLSIAVAVCFLVLPRCFIDYGESGDALDNATDAMHLAQYGFREGIPMMVRWPPGVPAFFYLLTLIVPWGGHVASNLAVFAFYIASVVLFGRMTKGVPHREWVWGMYALTPLILRDSALTQDFVPGLVFVMAVFLALESRRYALAGVLIGVATGFRLTNVLLVLPATLHLGLATTEWPTRARLRAVVSMNVLAVACGLVWYAPFVYVSELGWRYFMPLKGHGTIAPASFAYNMAYVFGPLALMTMLGVLFYERKRVSSLLCAEWKTRSPRTVFLLVAVLVYLIICLRFVMKVSYILPAIPFLYLLLADWVSKRGLQAIAITVASFSIVNLELKGGQSGRRVLAPHLDWGCVVADWSERSEIRDLRRGISQLRSLGKAVVLTGMGGILTRGNDELVQADAAALSPRLDPASITSVHRAVNDIVHRVRGSDVFLIAGLSESNVDLLRHDGFKVYMFSQNAPSYVKLTFGYDPYSDGVEVLDVFDSRAFYRDEAHAAR